MPFVATPTLPHKPLCPCVRHRHDWMSLAAPWEGAYDSKEKLWALSHLTNTGHNTEHLWRSFSLVRLLSVFAHFLEVSFLLALVADGFPRGA